MAMIEGIAIDDDDFVDRGNENQDILEQAKLDFERVLDDEADRDNKAIAIADTRFGQLSEQWDERIVADYQRQGKPNLTFNKLNSVIRQVVNDARQNKPQIKVLPVDDEADPKTADILAGLIRNIENVSKASNAYDMGAEHAAVGGVGYWQVVIDYARNDSFELDLLIKRITDPNSVYGDPDSEAADSSDWNTAFITQRYSKAKFEREFGSRTAKIDWEGDRYGRLTGPWRNDDGVLVANHYRREEYQKTAILMSDGSLIDEAVFTPELMMTLAAEHGVEPVREVTRPCHKVTQYLMTGAEVLKTIPWPGQYIPIVPVYGHEYWVEGRRYLRGVIHDAKEAQQTYNFWRSVSTELVALAPKQPWLLHKGAITAANAEQWATANRISYPYLVYEGNIPPSRIQMDMGSPAGAITEALSANDDIKAITGIYDASLGNRSNETSGVAINARKVEGDTSTFNFPDNVSRAVAHTGVILLDVIPHVYNEQRIIRVLGLDETPETHKLGSEMPVTDPETGEPVMQEETDEFGQPVMDPETGGPKLVPLTKILDLSAGKYDVVVQAGPSYTTRRQEALQQLTDVFQAVPDAAQAALDIYMKATDMPMADELAKRFKEHFNLGGPPPAVQEMQGQMEEMNGQMEQAGQQMQALQTENEELKSKTAMEAQQLQTKTQIEVEKMAIEREKLALERETLALENRKLQVEQMKIEADLEKTRISAQASRPLMLQPAAQPQPGPMPY